MIYATRCIGHPVRKKIDGSGSSASPSTGALRIKVSSRRLASIKPSSPALSGLPFRGPPSMSRSGLYSQLKSPASSVGRWFHNHVCNSVNKRPRCTALFGAYMFTKQLSPMSTTMTQVDHFVLLQGVVKVDAKSVNKIATPPVRSSLMLQTTSVAHYAAHINPISGPMQN